MEISSLKIANNNRVLYVFVACSVLFHLLISFISLKESVPDFFTEKKVEKVIPIKLLALKKEQSKQIITTEKSISKKAVDAKFLSETNNYFDRQTKSSRNGSFQSAAKGERTARNQKDTQVVKKSTVQKTKKLSFSDLAFKFNESIKIKKKRKVAKKQSAKKGLKTGKKSGVALGQTNDFLEDIPLGDFTKLNSQEYEFYGFYNRIKQKLEQFWGLNIQEKADAIYKHGRSIASDTNLVTGLTIQLNNRGEIVEILVKSASGIKELDDAAIESFNQAGPFPNPPKGMIKNGKATIEWGFVVNT